MNRITAKTERVISIIVLDQNPKWQNDDSPQCDYMTHHVAIFQNEEKSSILAVYIQTFYINRSERTFHYPILLSEFQPIKMILIKYILSPSCFMICFIISKVVSLPTESEMMANTTQSVSIIHYQFYTNVYMIKVL